MRQLGLIAVVFVVVLAGCSPGVGDAPAATPTSQTSALASADLDWSAQTISGSKLQGSSLLGKPTVLWFWAPWCPICADQVPEVKRLVEQYRDRANLVGIGGLDKAAAIRSGLEVIDGVTTIVDDSGKVWADFRVTQQAVYVVLDAQGHITWNSQTDPDQSAQISDKLAAVSG